MGSRILAILMGFFTRIIFTRTLSAEYVGVNGLFTDILNVLALSEMGVGTAITFALYKPIADNDLEKQKSLMRLYKVFYRMVAGIVAIAGLALVPFLPYLMKDDPHIPGLTVIYLMYLSNSVLSYFMIYKKTLIEASQQSYIDVLYHTVFLVLQNVLQIVILLTTGNFILFLAVLILCTLGYNITISKKAEKMFPFLKEKDVEKLPEAETRDVHNNVRSLMMHKIGNVLVNNTDNILLARLVSSVAVGCYSNYYLVIGSIRQILSQAFMGITASVGNLGVSNDNEHVKKVYNASVLAAVWLYGFAAITLYLVVDPFVGFCFGESYVFDSKITMILCINFYLTGVRQPSLVFRDSMGLFKHDRWVSLIEALVNLVVSVALGMRYGIIGVFLGTMISTLLTSFWVEPFILFKYRLKVSSLMYFLKLMMYTMLTVALALVQKYIYTSVSIFNTDSQMGAELVRAFFLRLICCVIFTNLVYLLISLPMPAFKTLYSKFLFLVGKRKEKRAERKTENKEDEDLYDKFSEAETWILQALEESLTGKKKEKYKECRPNILATLNLMLAHAVTPLLDKQTEELVQGSDAPEALGLHREIKAINDSMTLYAMRQIFLTKNLSDAFEKADCKVAILKGIATGKYYGKPEKRKSGDVDILLLEPHKLAQAKEIVISLGCDVKEEQPALHHIVFNYKKTNIDIELHTMLVEPFDNNTINKYVDGLLAECVYHTKYINAFGVRIPALTGAFHAYELLLHMLQHFLRAGFGLKLLCDWVVFWNNEVMSEEEKEIYLRLVIESGVKGFSDMITLICLDYLGLDEKNVVFMDLDQSRRRMDRKAMLLDIFEGEEFGHANKERMVALRGSSPWDYIREFHHQMRLNHPRTSRIILFWPVLWVVTYVVFIRNNKKLRQTDTREIYEKAGRRGRIVKEMKLFKG